MNTLIESFRTDLARIFRYPRLNLVLNCMLIPLVCLGFYYLAFIAADKIYWFLLVSDWSLIAFNKTVLTVSVSIAVQVVCIYTARYFLNPTLENLNLLAKAWLAGLWRLFKVLK